MKIALFNTKPYDKASFERYRKDEEIDLTFFDYPLNIETAYLTAGFEAVCVFVNDKVDSDTIKVMKDNGIRLIALRCAGYNNLDLDSAKESGIQVVRVPSYSPEAVAEHSMALILTLNRKTHKAYNRIREGNFSLTKLMGFNLYKKTIGVIGTGQIGAAFCRIAKGFGCRVIAYDIFKSKTLMESGVEYLPVEEVFQQSDIISLHCPLNPDTKHIINQQAIALMKDGVMLINTSRGGLVDTVDVVEGLKQKKIGFLGIDVYEQEENLFHKDLSEMIIEDELILKLNSFPNVLITSHQAYFTSEAIEEITLTTLKNIREFRKGLPLENLLV